MGEPRPRAVRFLFVLLPMGLAMACELGPAPVRPAEPPAPKTTAATPKAPSAQVAPTPAQPAPIEPPAPASSEPPAAATPPAAEPPPAADEPSAQKKGPQKSRPVREIHPEPGQTSCVQMYGSCTRGSPPVCTSSAISLECGERGRMPETGERLHCVCP